MNTAIPSPGPAAHGHAAQSAAAAGARRLGTVLLLVVGYLIAEVVGGLLTNSLALLADAGHMFTDAAGIGLALLAIWFARRPSTPEQSFGYYRVPQVADECPAALPDPPLLIAVS